MKRVAIGLLMLFGYAWAQAPFTIVRPVDGARVREKVQVRVPLRSVPSDGFIGVSVDGKFIEAVAPAALRTDKEKGHLIYEWDTKARNIPDGRHTIELTLYGGGNERRVLARSSVNVTVENKIKVPADGIRLQYKWVSGRNFRYRVHAIAKDQTELKDTGLSPEETLLLDVKFGVDLYTHDFTPPLALIAWMPVAPALILEGGQYRVITGENMAPVYQEIETTGRVRYQESRLGESQQYEFYYVTAGDLPELPPKKVKEGFRWTMTFVQYDPLEAGEGGDPKVAARFPIPARIESFEWERGYKCAKIVCEFRGNLPGRFDLGEFRLEKPTVKVKRVIYFAYDIGQVVRMTTSIEFETTLREQIGGSGGMGGFGGPFGPPGGGRGGMGAGDEEGGMPGYGGRGGRSGRGGGMALGGQPPGTPGMGMGQPGTGRGTATMPGQAVVNRLIFVEEWVLSRIF
ncbi:MAG: hypothetical protein NZL85_00595 [Fimbriimonadales bacterium]|nr:hypothetical protein [Fimbriimonadales bacterium]